MGSRILSQEQLDEMVELREVKRWTSARIARRFTSASTPIKRSTIHYQCLRLGIDAPPERQMKLGASFTEYRRNGYLVRAYTPEEDRQLLELEAKGLTYAEIGDEIGRKPNSVAGRIIILTRKQIREEAAIA